MLMSGMRFWKDWGLVSRLILAVGAVITAGGGMQTYLFVVGDATEQSARLQRELNETLVFMMPLIADQALLGDYAGINQLLDKQVQKGEVESFKWSDTGGRWLVAQDKPDSLDVPFWFINMAPIKRAHGSIEVSSGGVSYGYLNASMTTTKAHNRLWLQFVKQVQIVAVALMLILQFIWLIFRGNLGTLRMLAEGSDRFSRGEYAVRITPRGSPEVSSAAEAFNNMAQNIEGLIDSLGQSESKSKLLATIVEQSSEAIWTRDLTHVITSWNSGAASMFGYSPTEAVGQAFEVGLSTPSEEKERHDQLAAGQKFSYDTKAHDRIGNLIDIQVSVAPLLDVTNQCIGSIAVARDVTQQKRSEEELREARQTAEAASNAKSSFLARMSHEIRTPMNGVLGMTELLLETGLTSTQRKYAETVQRSGQNLLGIINDLLDFSKIEAGKLDLENVDMDIRRTIEDVLDLLAERAHSKGLELASSMAANFPLLVKGDPLRLGQVLTNLVGNAIKFTERGSVVVRALVVKSDAQKVSIRFEVTDTGMGIRTDAQARIFEEFSQADGSTTRQHGGSGLGLAISKQLVDMMGGRILLDSALGSGSTFSFTIALEKQELPQQQTAPMGMLTGVRALIIESIALNSGMLHSQMSNWGLTIRVAQSQDQAIELLAEASARGAPYDIAIIDFALALTGMDALELARSIRSRVDIGKMRLVMLTRRQVDNRHALEASFDAYLEKPVRQTVLYECLVNVMAGHTPDVVAPPSVRGSLSTSATGFQGNILLVEDNLINQQVALGILQLQGFNVTVANNGREALNASALTAFDLVLMDCHMPEMDGFEATRAFRAREQASGSKPLPIIALTANAMAQDRQACLDVGMDDHLSKPFSMLALKEMLGRWMPQSATKSQADELDSQATAKPSQVLDRQVLEQLAKVRTNGKAELLIRVINLYLAESPKLVQRMKQAALVGDPNEIAAAAHALKSSSANVGANLLSSHCEDIELSAQQADTAQASKILATIEAEHVVVQSALAAELQTLIPSKTKEAP